MLVAKDTKALRGTASTLMQRFCCSELSVESAGTMASLPYLCLGSKMEKMSWYTVASRCLVSAMGQVRAEHSSVSVSAERWQLAWHQDHMLSSQCNGSDQ